MSKTQLFRTLCKCIFQVYRQAGGDHPALFSAHLTHGVGMSTDFFNVHVWRTFCIVDNAMYIHKVLPLGFVGSFSRSVLKGTIENW